VLLPPSTAAPSLKTLSSKVSLAVTGNGIFLNIQKIFTKNYRAILLNERWISGCRYESSMNASMNVLCTDIKNEIKLLNSMLSAMSVRSAVTLTTVTFYADHSR
jgi:hypothetical protein